MWLIAKPEISKSFMTTEILLSHSKNIPFPRPRAGSYCCRLSPTARAGTGAHSKPHCFHAVPFTMWLSTVLAHLGCLAASEVRRSSRVSSEAFAATNKPRDRCVLSWQRLREELLSLEERSAPLGTQALCWVPWPWARPLECQSNPCFSSESSAVAFWPEVTLCYLAFFPLKERNDAGEIFGFNGVKLLILPSNWHLSISSDLYWTIAFPPLLAFLITSASQSGEIPLLPMGKIQRIDQDKKIKRNNKKENYCRAKWAPFFGTTS